MNITRSLVRKTPPHKQQRQGTGGQGREAGNRGSGPTGGEPGVRAGRRGTGGQGREAGNRGSGPTGGQGTGGQVNTGLRETDKKPGTDERKRGTT
ncbi:hypothetical protein EYF80_067147 [Liparis tanakae]|uniref:Uncharacterized protein n=1 Tax=Liparis tanakae TaxID=230148 RepID=A0A4Z2E1Z2_9TELE|nr:hypothetical protein EYF80_067147 [Liparis tanakae]